MKGLFGRKKEPVVEKKPLTLNEMKMKVGTMNLKAEGYLKKVQAICDKNIAKAIEKKSHNQDCSSEIRRIAACKSNIQRVERMQSMWEEQLDNFELCGLSSDFFTSMGEFAESINVAEMAGMNDQVQAEIARSIEKLNEQQMRSDELMGSFDIMMRSMDNQSTLSDVEKDIFKSINDAVNDAQLGIETSTSEVAEKVKQKIGLSNM